MSPRCRSLRNPREVVLKVTELLEGLTTTAELDKGNEDQEEEVESSVDHEQATPSQTNEPSVEKNPSSQHGNPTASPMQGDQDELREPPSRASQFRALVDMLAILHPRIKTKYPSRFLSTSLQSLLSAYATQLTGEETTDAVLHLIKTFAGSRRPKLPPRRSGMHLLTQPQGTPDAAPDPEANQEPVPPEENDLQQRLLQSFLTFVVEGYLSCHRPGEGMLAMFWSSRLQEHFHPDKNIPGKRSWRQAFEEDESLHRRDSILGQMLVR